MAFENLTLFELNFDGARFGPQFGGDEDDVEEAYEVDDGSGGPRIAPFLGVLFLVVGVALAVRRYRGRGEEVEDGADADDGGITIEATTEQ